MDWVEKDQVGDALVNNKDRVSYDHVHSKDRVDEDRGAD